MDLDASRIRADVRAYLINEFGLAPSTSDDAALFSSGLLDSFNVFQLLAFCEQTYALRISPLDVGLESFDSIDNVAALVLKTRGS